MSASDTKHPKFVRQHSIFAEYWVLKVFPRKLTVIDISGYKDYFDLSLFLNHGVFPDPIYTKRHYTRETIDAIIEGTKENAFLDTTEPVNATFFWI